MLETSPLKSTVSILQKYSPSTIYTDNRPLVPHYESEELSPSKIIVPRSAHFNSVKVKDSGKLTIARNLSNMDDRLEYIEVLRDEMMRQIDDTDMVCSTRCGEGCSR